MIHTQVNNFTSTNDIITAIKVAVASHPSWTVLGEVVSSQGLNLSSFRTSYDATNTFNMTVSHVSSPLGTTDMVHISDTICVGMSTSALTNVITPDGYITNQTDSKIAYSYQYTVMYVDKNSPKVNIFVSEKAVFISLFDSVLLQNYNVFFGYLESYNSNDIACVSSNHNSLESTNVLSKYINPVFANKGITLYSNLVTYISDYIQAVCVVPNLGYDQGNPTLYSISGSYIANTSGLIEHYHNDLTFGSILSPVKFHICNSALSTRPAPFGRTSEIYIVSLKHLQNDTTITIGTDNYYIVKTTSSQENGGGGFNEHGYYKTASLYRDKLGFAIKLDAV